mmetsp:Transcript_9259/g.26276  ORF Transcript_9259/g.26276 Transcript_9259/m.26276 type:complete len:94 (-) Transcript_9259:234-515(-)
MSCLLGCVDVVACLSQAELQQLPLSDSQRIESESSHVFLCQNPRKLVLPLEMAGQHKLWRFPRKEAKRALSGLRSLEPIIPNHPTDFLGAFPR